MDEQIERDRASAFRRADEEFEDRRSEIGEDPSGILEEALLQEREERKKTVRLEWSTHVRATEEDRGATTLFGEPLEIVDALDKRVLKELAVFSPSNRAAPKRCTFRFSREYGCRLDVVGTDDAWVDAAFATICRQAERDVPRWTRVRSRWTGAVVFAASALLLAGGLGRYAPSAWDDGTVLAIGLAAGAWLVLFAVAVVLILQRLFPGFEFLEEGKQPRVTRAVVYAAGLLVTILVEAGVGLTLLALHLG